MSAPTPPPPADAKTDAKYDALEARYGADTTRASGYRLHRYFLEERKLLDELLATAEGRVLDVGCGTGLMGTPLLARGCSLLGLDFNLNACRVARSNGIAATRGNAFQLPFRTSSVDHAFCCQFFNQQPPGKLPGFFAELARVLREDGYLLLVWRNDQAWIHRTAHAAFTLLDVLTGRPRFPVFSHPMVNVLACAEATGFSTVRKLLSFPLMGTRFEGRDTVGARLFGASCVLLLKRTRSPASVAKSQASAV
ncbi:MAG: class I SAM-dependent methyltransferase [Pseudomonadota bacterium]